MDLSPSNDHDPNTNADLAALLATSYRDQESLRRELALYKKSADKADRLANVLLTLGATSSSSPAPSSPPSTNGNGNGTTDAPSTSSLTLSPQLAPLHAQQIHQIVADYEDKLRRTEQALEDAEARNRESWSQMNDILASLELHAQNARSFARPYIQHHVLSESPTAVGFPSSSSMPPPAGGSRQHSHSRSHSQSHVHAHSARLSSSRGAPVAFALPPHPIPNPNVALSHAPLAPSGSGMGGSGSTRRPRTPSMDNLYAAAQPPNKRSRASASSLDDQRGGTRAAYSESYIASPQHQQSEVHIRSLHALQRHSTGVSISGPGGASSPLPEAQPRIINRKYQSSASSGLVNIHPNPNTPSHPHARGAIDQHLSHRDRERGERAHTPTHSRSGSHSSASSMDVDEMIIKATTGDEAAAAMGNGTPNTNGRGYLDSPHHQQQQQLLSLAQQHQNQMFKQQQQQLSAPSRRRSERERESPIGTPGANPYPPGGQQGGQGYPANQSAPMRVLGGAASVSMSGGGAGSGSGQGQGGYTTVFAPVVTGAPTKKSKFPNSSGSVGGVTGGVGGSGPTLDSLSNTPSTAQTAQPTVPFPATNQNGQRICRQCGIVGRYKDGKCVEKWGPGPMGPGTVCDRCRKKMKRVERRGTLESQHQQQHALLQAQQQQQLQPRLNSHAQLPLSQSSDRSIQRSDTILTHQPSFFDESSANLRSSTVGTNQSTNTGTFTSSSKGTSARHQPTPPTIASLREQHDDEDDENVDRDPEQLPTSNIGRGVSAVISAANVNSNTSRSNSRNGRVRAASGKPTPPVTDSSYTRGSSVKQRTSISPRGGLVDDEMDADADADAEAEAEAEILGAVDAAGDGDGDDLDGDGDGEGDLENDADAEAELLEAVDAAEANSNSSSHGGERSWLKSEPN